MCFWTANTNLSWNTAKGVLEAEVAKEQQTGGIHIVGFQEHGVVSKEWCDEICASMLRKGWKVLFAPAAKTELGGAFAGTALCIPACVWVTFARGQLGWDISPPGRQGA